MVLDLETVFGTAAKQKDQEITDLTMRLKLKE